MSRLTLPPLRLVETPALSVIDSHVVYNVDKLVLKEIIEGEEAALIESGKYDKNTGTLTLIMDGDRVLAISGFPTSYTTDRGLDGDVGATGADGIDGLDGEEGREGDIGPQGPLGDRGRQGATGTSGATGVVGERGANGGYGPTGSVGAQGNSGLLGSFNCTEKGGIEFNYTSGLIRQWGNHASNNLTQAVEILFPKAFEGDINRLNLSLTFLDRSSIQATTYRLTELNKGGFVLAVDELLPLSSNWKFYWSVIGDDGSKSKTTVALPVLPNVHIPAVSISSAYLLEPDAGVTTNMIFKLSLEEVNTDADIVVTYTISNVTTSNNDLDGTGGTALIKKGSRYGEIKVPIKGDTLEEPEEQFKVTLTEVSRGSIQKDSALGTIKEIL